MSRSRRKHKNFKISGNTSNKKSRSRANRVFRRVNKIILKTGGEFFKLIREVSDVWDWPSDGLADFYWHDATKKDMSK